MISRGAVLLACALVWDCTFNSPMGVDTCAVQYEPLLVSKTQPLGPLLNVAEDTLKEEGFQVTSNKEPAVRPCGAGRQNRFAVSSPLR